ncbi:MAG: MBL fold metallo-hydrolase [Bacteroidota bacterium]
MSTVVQSFTVAGPFAENCYVCHSASEAVLIDPGCADDRERQLVLDYVQQHRLTMRHLLLTHAHLDHIVGCAFFAEHYGLGWQMHPDDAPLLRHAEQQAALFQFPIEPPPDPTGWLREGDTVTFGEATWQVLLAPGHSPGSICFYDEPGGFVIAGDVLFNGSIGRTDLWQGDLPTLLRSIETKLMPLPDDTVVYCGHGPATTIGQERRTNPFLVG